jgi:hypothetical protein
MRNPHGRLFALFGVFLVGFISAASLRLWPATIDLIQTANKAKWTNDRGESLAVPGRQGDPKGLVRVLSGRLEDGQKYSDVLQTHPRWVPNGWIEGRYRLTILPGTTFEAIVGFLDGADGSDGVVFEVAWEEGQKDFLLKNLKKSYSKSLESLRVGLEQLAGHSGFLIMRVRAGKSSGQDWAVWASAKLVPTGTVPAPAAVSPDIAVREKKPMVPVTAGVPSTEVSSSGPQATKIPIDRVIEATARLSRYHLKIEQDPPGLVEEGEMDELGRSIHLQVRLLRQNLPPTEFFFLNGKGYGRHSVSREWLRIQVPEKPYDYKQAAIECLRQGKIVSVSEDQGLWKAEVRLENIPARDNPELFYRSILKEWKDRRKEDMIRRLINASTGMKVETVIWISRTDLQVKKLRVGTTSNGNVSRLDVSFQPAAVPLPAMPQEALTAIGPGVPIAMLFFRLSNIGGWNAPTHIALAYRSLEFVKSTDALVRKYADTYEGLGIVDRGLDSGVYSDSRPRTDYHPAVIGAGYEDSMTRPEFYRNWLPAEYPLQIGFEPSYHHYGSGPSGVGFRWFFIFFSPYPDVIYSARDWGMGAYGNQMSFPNAIKEYGKQTLTGQKAAYVILGHILHLLHDCADPDHEKLVPHPGSGFNEYEVFVTKMGYCFILAAEIGLVAAAACGPISYICGPVAAAVAMTTCLATVDPEEMGFEKFVEVFWNPTRISGRIEGGEPIIESDYEAFFHGTGDFAGSIVRERGFGSDYDAENALGCGTLWLLPPIPPIPACNPDIQGPARPDDRYLTLMDEIGVHAIRSGAGFIRHFYEIVNPPPYVKDLTIRQAGLDRFHVYYVDEPVAPGLSGRLAGRARETGDNRPLYHGVPARLQAKFGPLTHDGKHRKIENGTVEIEGRVIPLRPLVRPGLDDNVYEAEFVPDCETSLRGVEKLLRIDATDYLPHWSGRTPAGDRLDRTPETVAYASSTPPYLLANYESDAPHSFLFKGGIVDPGWHVDRLQAFMNSDPYSYRWPIAQGDGIRVDLKITEALRDDLLILDGACGRYIVKTFESLERVNPEPRATLTLAEAGLRVRLEGDDPVHPILRIDCDLAAPVNAYTFPIAIDYEFRDGRRFELVKGEVELQVISKRMADSMRRARARGREVEVFKEVDLLDSSGLLDLREGLPRAFDPCKELGSIFCNKLPTERGALSRLKIGAANEVIFVDEAGDASNVNFSATGLTVGQDRLDPKAMLFAATASARPGLYLLAVKATVDGRLVGQFGLFIRVGR